MPDLKESTGYAELAFMLWGSPKAWPTSWEITLLIISPISFSGVSNVRALGLAAPVSNKYLFLYDFKWLWYHIISLSIISPVLGSETLGPTAFLVVEATYLTVENLMSSGLNSEFSSLLGGSFALIAFLKPAFSNTLFQSSIPLIK